MPTWSRRTARRNRRRRWNMSCSTPAVFERRPILRRLCGIRQGRSRRHSGANHGSQSRTRRGGTASAADAVVPKRLVRVDRRIESSHTEANPQADRGVSGRERGRWNAFGARRIHAFLRRRARRCSSPKMKPTTSGCSRATKTRAHYVKDGINDCVVLGNRNAVNPANQGTKVSAHYPFNVGSGQTQVIRLRLSEALRTRARKPFGKSI